MIDIGGHRPRARRPVSAALLALVSAAVLSVASACASDPSSPSAGDLTAVADTMNWPGDHVPTGDQLSRFAEAGGGTADAEIDVGRANICAWYQTWHADYLPDSDASPAVLDHLEDHLPNLPYLEGVSGGPDAIALMAEQAAAGEVEPIETYLELNHCAALGMRASG